MAQYSITVALVPGAEFTVTGDTVDELLDEWEHVKGNRDWLVGTLFAAVPATEAGEGVGALTATINSALDNPAMVENDEPAWPETPDDDMGPDEPESDSKVVDPWTSKTVTDASRRRPASRSGPSGGTSAHPASRPQRNTGDTAPVEKYDRYDNKYVIGLPDAPMDENGHGPMVLKTWTNSAGKTFTAFKCPNQAPGGNYSQKCDAHAWPPR